MGRLIDEDELIKGRVENDPVVIAAKCTPTAYDLGKVVEQLKDEQELSYADFEIYAEEHGLSEDDDWHHRGLGRAVEIVRRGGVDGN